MGYLTKESLDKIATDPGKYAMEDTSVISAWLNKNLWTPIAAFVVCLFLCVCVLFIFNSLNGFQPML